MAKINIVVDLVNPDPLYLSSNIRYARIDNTTTPIYTTITNVGGNLYIIPNLDNGQYIVGVTPNFSDSRTCPERTFTTTSCSSSLITAFSVTVASNGSLDIVYDVSDSAILYQLVVSNPNGTTSGSVNLTPTGTTGNTYTYTPPSGLSGIYVLALAPICDVDTGFIGQSVTITATTGTVAAIAQESLVGSIASITGIVGFALPSALSASNTINGYHSQGLASGSIVITYSTASSTTVVGLKIGGVLISTTSLPMASTSVTLSGVTFTAIDAIELTFYDNA